MSVSFVIPDKMPKFQNFSSEQYKARAKYIYEGMFAFVSWKWVNPFAEWIGDKKCLEVMSGRGILTYALRQKGIDIIATDDFSWAQEEDFKKWKNTVTEVEKLDAIEAVKKYGAQIDILIMSWPYMDDTAFRVIQKLNEINPNAIVVYIGEWRGGCTADDAFFDHFEEIEDEKFYDEKFYQASRNYERWSGIHDYVYLGKYTK